MRTRQRRRWHMGAWVAGAMAGLLAGCSTGEPGVGHYKLGRPYQIAGQWYRPSFDPTYDRIGVASWYGDAFHGRRTANGEVFDKDRISAAHPTLPLPSIVRVTNLANERTIEVRVNDRGPFVADRIIDLSQAGARELGFERRGTTPVRVEFVALAEARGRPPQPTVSPAPTTAIAARPPTSPRAPSLPPQAEVTLAAEASGSQCPPPGRYIQVAAFTEGARAVALARQLDPLLSAQVRAQPPAADRYARVRLGPLGSHREVADSLRRLKQIGYVNAFPVDDRLPTLRRC